MPQQASLRFALISLASMLLPLSGLAAPTVLPLAHRDDLVAVHLVTEERTFWSRVQELRALGATGIVALPPDALVR